MPILLGYHPVQEGCVANTCNTGWRLLSKPWARQTAQATELTCLEAVLSQGGAGGCWLSTKPHSRCGSVIPGQKSHSSLAHSLSCLTSSPLLPVCSGMVSIWTACTQILSQSLFLGIGKPRDQKKKMISKSRFELLWGDKMAPCNLSSQHISHTGVLDVLIAEFPV